MADADIQAQYKASTLLMFLTSHDEDHAKILGLDLGCLDKDVGGTLTIEKQRVTIKLQNGLTFTSKETYDYYTRMWFSKALFLSPDIFEYYQFRFLLLQTSQEFFIGATLTTPNQGNMTASLLRSIQLSSENVGGLSSTSGSKTISLEWSVHDCCFISVPVLMQLSRM